MYIIRNNIGNTCDLRSSAAITLPDPSLFPTAVLFYLRHCDVFVMNFTAAKFRTLPRLLVSYWDLKSRRRDLRSMRVARANDRCHRCGDKTTGTSSLNVPSGARGV
ncbi:hypothetical protein EVAR_62090_1 [Eumeta japonica]|uniref:Uncharacterized protein n=1 Tax=Eumeta variegata TaxID=151549 RepID=A0A4C1Z0J6_EUMVA|nr:hypothetical protein EVAR_62090_1 [Eumeta japonica]